jgi:phosphomevalonate kinase
MIARAPGKLVVSGAYSVLEGAPAIVVAVDRYATADTSRPPERVTDEVRAAIDARMMRSAPWFDASALRATLPDGRDVKLGLGSSAAILVASMAAAWAIEDRTLDPRAMFQASLAAHRTAQGGGSGIDVAASVFGGALACRLQRPGESRRPPPPSRSGRASNPDESAPVSRDLGLSRSPHVLPEGAVLEAFASPVSASTPDLVGRVRAFAERSPADYGRLIEEASRCATRTLQAASVDDLVTHLRAQARALAALGEASGAPIFTADVAQLAPFAEAEGAVFYPSGAGGGDVALYAGPRAPSERFRREAEAFGRFHLELRTGAPGVHLVSTASPSGALLGAL